MQFLRPLALVLVVAAVTACADTSKPAALASTASSAASSSTTVSCSRPHAAGQSSETLDFKGQTRTYQLYVPAVYDGTRPVPVIFNFHGFGSNAVQQMVYGNFKPLADRDDFLIVALDGQGDSRHFNLSGESGLQDDLAVVAALLDRIEATLCVDAKRVYSTGMSDGGAMTSALACSGANRFAAFGAVAVVFFVPSCTGSPATSIAGFMGTDDPIVPFNGGPVHCCGGVSLPAASDSMASWAAHDGCELAFNDARVGTDVRKRTWTGCKPGSEVVFYIIDGGGHTWPGSIPIAQYGKTTNQIDASATIWDFFTAHPLP
jgi:polyhydroxybutyrate depolymerase